MKKGQSISINTIIIAAIGLAVLVVLFAIFTGRIGNFSDGLKNTDTCTQKCVSLNAQRIYSTDQGSCTSVQSGQFIAGKYTDTDGGVCCCK